MDEKSENDKGQKEEKIKLVEECSPNSGRSDNNNNGKQKIAVKTLNEGEEWLGPGMIAEDRRHGVTAADLLLGKKRLKPTTRQSNNNCNKTSDDQTKQASIDVTLRRKAFFLITSGLQYT